MEITFLKIKGVYTCMNCLKDHEIEYELNGNPGCYDAGIELDCECGYHFEMMVDFG